MAAKFRNQIDRKRVDFVLVDPATFATHTVIELDDRSHARPDRMQRDTFVEEMLAQAGIDLVRIPVAPSYSAAKLRLQLVLDVKQVRSA